jgi:hypothetical protein
MLNVLLSCIHWAINDKSCPVIVVFKCPGSKYPGKTDQRFCLLTQLVDLLNVCFTVMSIRDQ